MKKLSLLSVCIILLLASGCPSNFEYPLGERNKQPIDKRLLGTWAPKLEEGKDAEVLKVKISEASTTQYAIEVLEKGELYIPQTTTLDGWLTSIDKTDFVCIQPQGEEFFYHYAISFNQSNLIANDVSFFDAGLDSIHSTEDFRAKVAVGMQRENWAQGTTTWVRD